MSYPKNIIAKVAVAIIAIFPSQQVLAQADAVEINCPEIKKQKTQTKRSHDLFLINMPLSYFRNSRFPAIEFDVFKFRSINAQLTFENKIKKEFPIASCTNYNGYEKNYLGKFQETEKISCFNNYTKESYSPDSREYSKDAYIIEQRRNSTYVGGSETISNPPGISDQTIERIGCLSGIIEDKSGKGICVAYTPQTPYVNGNLDSAFRPINDIEGASKVIEKDGTWRGRVYRYGIEIISVFHDTVLMVSWRTEDGGFYCARSAKPVIDF